MIRISEHCYLGRAQWLILIAAAAALTFLASGLRAQQTGQAASTAGNTENGRRLFVMKDACYQCHGTLGQGGVGPRLGPHPLDQAAFVAFVRNPRRGMPPYSPHVLSDSEIADIRAYLTTAPQPPPVKDIPLLNQ